MSSLLAQMGKTRLGTLVAEGAFGVGQEEASMRVLIGIVLGAVLTVGGAYLYDSHTNAGASPPSAGAQRPMVNWDVVSTKWNHLAARARAEWNRIASSS